MVIYSASMLPVFDKDSCAAHLALVQVADNLLEEPLLQLLLRPHVLSVPRYQVGGAGFVRPLWESNRTASAQEVR